MLLDILTADDLVAADDIATELEEARIAFYESLSGENEDFGDEADDAPIPETRILRPWHQNKSVGPWGPKGPKGKRVTLRSHRTGR